MELNYSLRGDSLRSMGFCCCPALSSELGLRLLTSQVVRGSAGLGFAILAVHPFGVPLATAVSGTVHCSLLKFQLKIRPYSSTR